MGGKELEFIKDAFDKNWITPLGENVDRFEDEIKKFVGMPEALALSSGTAALHLAMKVMGLKEKDYVFCSSLTFFASVNPVLYEKATPVFIDSDEESWNMDPLALAKAFEWAEKTNHMPKFVIVVDIYGQSAKYDEIKIICDKYHVPILEDAAEALGATYHGKNCGTFGHASCLSFNGNKIITTSGGGMVLCHSKEERNKMFFWSTQSREKKSYYEHKEIGYNYRLSNICAAIGRGQMEVLAQRVKKKREIYNDYQEGLRNCPIQMMSKLDYAASSHWLSAMTINEESDVTPDKLIKLLESHNIESRRVWKPMHMQPIFKENLFFTNQESDSVSQRLFEYGLCLPSDTNMTCKEQNEVIQLICSAFQN